MFQLNLFNAKLAACEVSKAEIALVIGCNESTLYRKLSGKSDFARNEIQMIRQKLNLSAEEIESIFFCIKLAFTQVLRGDRIMSILISMMSLICIYNGLKIKNHECRTEFYHLGRTFAVIALIFAIT